MTKEELQKFCSTDRESLSKPFTQGNYTYASDGRLMIRVPALPDAVNPDAPKDVERIVFDSNPIDPSKVHLVGSLKIPKLEGSSDCPVCKGTADHFCTKCEGLHPCGKCNGTGSFPENPIRVPIGEHSVSHILLNAIKDLPNCSLQESSRDSKSALGIIFDGGDGRLMPMTKD